MDGSTAAVLTLGFGAPGSTGLVLTLGFGTGAEAAVSYAKSCSVLAFSRQSVPAISKSSKPAISRQSVPDTECCQ